jgi:virulence factor
VRVGVIGLGDIARKAYLPVLAVNPSLEVHLCSRGADALAAVGDALRIPHRHRDVGQLLAAGIDAAFVHVATGAHVEIVTTLLKAGVPTYVDKPLSYELSTSARLVDLARAGRCSLMVGFNRRYAPVYRQLLDVQRSLVVMQKNRVRQPREPRIVVLDDFIHVVDTLRFLTPGATLSEVQGVMAGDSLQQLVVTMAGEGVTAIGLMNRDGGATDEVLEVHGTGRKRRVVDMAEIVDHNDGVETVGRRGDWTPVERQRGFEAICAEFLTSVRKGVLLDAGDALRTHEMCEEIVGSISSSQARSGARADSRAN